MIHYLYFFFSQRIAHAFATQYPNSALVLDDVWDENVLKAFEKVACKVRILRSFYENFSIA